MHATNPILVELTRGSEVESVHRGAAAVVDGSGKVVQAWGDIDRAVYPRSATKPLQAIPLLTSGAAAAFGVTSEEVALACASHSGEPIHTSTVSQWLERLDLDVDALECGAHPPTDKRTRDELTRAGRAPSPLHNNCSGKHSGFLTICRHLGFPTVGYINAEHPVQELVRDTVSRYTGCTLDETFRGVDGCGIPVYGIPLRGLATGMTRLIQWPEHDEPDSSAGTIVESMITHPYLVAGKQRFCSVLMEALAPNVVAKTGAEGVYCAAVRDQGLGIALKIDDGATRAAEVALGAVLRALGAIDDSHFDALRSTLEPDIVNVAGKTVGTTKAAAGLVRARA